VLKNVRNYSPSDTASHPRRLESSARDESCRISFLRIFRWTVQSKTFLFPVGVLLTHCTVHHNMTSNRKSSWNIRFLTMIIYDYSLQGCKAIQSGSAPLCTRVFFYLFPSLSPILSAFVINTGKILQQCWFEMIYHSHVGSVLNHVVLCFYIVSLCLTHLGIICVLCNLFSASV
jgi:hypothetical protein